MTVIGVAEVEVRSDSSKFAADAEKDIKAAMGGVTESVGKSAKIIGGALAGVFAVEKVGAFAGSVITAASDMSETLSKSKNVFGDQAAAIEEWASTSATAFGISKQAALAATAQYGDMFKQLGFTGTAAKNASTNLIKTAADLGSFHNVDPSEVLERIGGALRGEFDSLQQLIPNLNAARVETEALAMTGKKAAKELTAQEKATATLAIIQKDGALAANDFAETSGGLANRQRILAAQFEDIKAKIGAGLLPVMTKLSGFVLDKMIPTFSKLERGLKDFFSGFKDGKDEVDGTRNAIGQFGSDVGRLLDAIKPKFQELGDSLRELSRVALADVRELWDKFGDDITRILKTALDALYELVDPAFQILQGAIDVASGLLTANWTKIWDGLKTIVSGVFEAIKTIVSTAMQLLLDEVINPLGQKIVDWFLDLPENLKSALGDLGPILYGKGQDLMRGLQDGIKEFWQTTLKQWFISLPGFLRDMFMDGVNWLNEQGKSVLKGLQKGVEDGWDGTDGGGGLKQWFKDLPERLRNEFKDAKEWNKEDGKNIINGMWDGMKERWSGGGDGNGVQPWLEKIGDRMNVILKEAPSWLYARGQDVVRGLSDGIRFAFTEFQKYFNSAIRDKIVEGAKDAGTWLEEAGKNAIRGLIRGIDSQLKPLKDAMGRVTGAIDDYLPHSPAKEGPLSGRGYPLYAGQAIVQSLAEGVQSESDRLRTAMNGLFSGVTPGSTSGFSVQNPGGNAASASTSSGAVLPSAGSVVHIASLTIQNNKTFQENMDEIGRLDRPLVGV